MVELLSKANLIYQILFYLIKRTCPGVKHVSSGHVACHLSDSSAGLKAGAMKGLNGKGGYGVPSSKR